MKIKLYIVTYKKNDVLNENLRSLWKNTKKPENIEVTVLANHPDIHIEKENLRDNLRVVINTTRMPHAWGYLSRDWNFCILDGFKTWKNPDNTDYVIMAQNDVTWIKNWDEWLAKNTDFDFISQPRGDQCMVINIEAVKKIGFFDERFTTIAFQENDYFRRAILNLGNRCCINDDHADKTFGPMLLDNKITKTVYSGCVEDDTIHTDKTTADAMFVLMKKYGQSDYKTFISSTKFKPVIKEINWYPFFWDGYADIQKQFDIPTPKKIRFKLLRRILACFVPSRKLRHKIRG